MQSIGSDTVWVILALGGLLAILFLAGGCASSSLPVPILRQVNDNNRDLATAALCATTLGAHYRDENLPARKARECLCGGEC